MAWGQAADQLAACRRLLVASSEAGERRAARLDAIADLIAPCPLPDVAGGDDMCPCGYGGTFPCPTTQAAWIARDVNPGAETHRLLSQVFFDDCGAS